MSAEHLFLYRIEDSQASLLDPEAVVIDSCLTSQSEAQEIASLWSRRHGRPAVVVEELWESLGDTGARDEVHGGGFHPLPPAPEGVRP